jgi:D-3-phosphoglycerate dehydrogenase
MSGFRVVLLEDRYAHHRPERAILGAIGAEVVEAGSPASEADILSVCAAADGIAVNLGTLNERVIAGLDRCRVIVRYGVGYDNVDVEAATARGIAVANVPDYCAEDVSDQAFALFMACVRQVALRDREVRRGRWNIQAGPIFRVAGKTFGLIGYGNIPQVLHRKLTGFGLGRVLTYDPFIPKAVAEKNGAEVVDLDVLLCESDFISVHAPLNVRTHHLIGKEQFARMKREAILVNTSRGGLVDTAALYDALRLGVIRAAGLDVHEQEPVSADYSLFSLDNVVLSDHIGWYSEESQVELQSKVAHTIVEVLRGKWPKNVVNREALARAGRVGSVSSGAARGTV